MSGAKAERPGLPGGILLRPHRRHPDRLAPGSPRRSLKDLVQKVEDLQQRQVGFRSLHESIDTTSSVGKLQFHVFSALAEFERDLIRDRTMAGLRGPCPRPAGRTPAPADAGAGEDGVRT